MTFLMLLTIRRKLKARTIHPSNLLMKLQFLFVSAVAILLQNFVFTPVLSMRIIVQRVKSASVTVEDKTVSSIGPGILALVGLHQNDTEDDLKYCCKRLLGAKLWSNENGAMWRHGAKQKGFPILCVSQFTLYGTLSKKNQPDYKLAMKAIPAEELYNGFLKMLREQYEHDKIYDGVFGAMMDVQLVNDGPVTIMIESEPKEPTVPEQGQQQQKEGDSAT